MRTTALALLSPVAVGAVVMGHPMTTHLAPTLASRPMSPPLRLDPNMRPVRTAPRSRVQAVTAMAAPETDFYAEFKQTDPVTGESQALDLQEKEKLYLDCLDAYYNEGGKQLLPDDEFDRLKLDLDFEGSKVATFSKDEILFVVANKRYAMGTPILDDTAYDDLRKKLKEAGSVVVQHEVGTCNIDGICKADLRVDNAKQRLLYLPGTIGAVVLLMETFYWTLHLDPFFSILLGAIPAYFAGVFFTENIFASKPLATVGPCPNCNYLNSVYFGDLLGVQADGIAKTNNGVELETQCPNCKAALICNRETMLVTCEKTDLVAGAVKL